MTTIISQTVPVADKNRALNPSFENGITGYTLVNCTSADNTTAANVKFGTHARAITVTSIAADVYLHQGSNYANPDSIRLSAAQAISAVSWIKAVGANRSARMRVRFYSSANALLVTVDGSLTALSTTSHTQVLVDGAIAPDVTAYVLVSVMFPAAGGNIAVSDVFYVDGYDVRIRSAYYEPYLDGTQPGAFWTGTAHASVSQRTAESMRLMWPDVTVGTSGTMTVRRSLILTNLNNDFRMDLTGYLIGPGSISANEDNETAKMEFSAPIDAHSVILDPFVDYVAPFLYVQMPDGTIYDDGNGYGMQMGLFVLVPPGRSYGETDDADLIGRSIDQILSRRAYDVHSSAKVGTNVVKEVIRLLAEQGFTRVRLSDEGRTITKVLNWPIGTTVLKRVNDLLGAIGMYELFPDRRGFLTSMRYRKMTGVAADATYNDHTGTVVTATPVTTAPHVDEIFNHVLAVHESTDNGKTTILKAIRRNTNPASPTSITRIGLQSAPPFQNSDVQTQADLDAYADKLQEELGAVYWEASLETLPEPFHDLHEVYVLGLHSANGQDIDDLSGRFWCKSWSCDFSDESGVMQHNLYRILDYVGTI